MKHEKLTRMLSAFLLLVIFASLTSVAVFSLDSQSESESLTTEIYADDLLEDCFNVVMGNAEKQYLKNNSGFYIVYNNHIPSTVVSTAYDIDTEILNIRVTEYTYSASNGVNIVWKPISVTFDTQTLPLSGPEYTAQLTGVSIDVGENINIEFETEFLIDETKVNELLKLAYKNAPLLEAEVNSKSEEYQRLNVEYLSHKQNYENYLILLDAYNEYLSNMRIYNEKFAEYSEYEEEYKIYLEKKAEFDAYNEALKKYNSDYALYLDYKAYMDVYNSQKETYDKYITNIAIAKEQLSVIHAVKTNATSLSRSVYSAIIGDTVTTVIANKDLITSSATGGADPKVVDLAGAATENLRSLFSGFFSITSEQEQYNYYVTNYEAFRDNFTNLFRALDKLYLYPKIRAYLIAQEKQQKYLILLAELYYVTNALNDSEVKNYDGTVTYDSGYIIGKGYKDASTPIAIMEGKEYIKDINSAAPLKDGYPAAVEKPVSVEEVKEPVKPTPVSEPTEPECVPEPIKPTLVTEPEVVSPPGNPPVEYIPNGETLALIAAYQNGELESRDYSGDFLLNPKITVTKKFYNVEYVTATFYDREYTDKDNAEIAYQITVDRGTSVVYAAPVPQKEDDFDYFYQHSGWSDADGERIDLTKINRDVEIYPTFSKIEKVYTPVWVVEEVEYSSMPQNPQKAPSGKMYYSFDGWDSEKNKDTCIITYTARFKELPMLDTPYGGAGITISDSSVKASVGSYNGPYKIDNILAFYAEKYAFTLEAAKGTISFSYSDTLAMKNAGVSSVKFSVVRAHDGFYTYRYELFDGNGNPVTEQFKANLTVPCITDDPERLELSYDNNGEKKVIKAKCDGNQVSFAANSGVLYRTAVEYVLESLPISNATISLDKTVAKAGDKITVSVTLPLGIRLDRVYFINSAGEKHEISNGEFVMPAEDITIGIDYTVEEYIITFVSDGKTIASFKHKYGDTVVPPKDPQKAATDNFSYTFAGWDAEVLPATESVVYTAVYARQIIPRDEKSGLQISPSVMKLLLLGFSAVSVVFLMAIPSSIMTVVVLKKRKKKLKNNTSKP